MKKGCLIVGLLMFLFVVAVSLLFTIAGTSPVLGEKVGLVRIEGVILDGKTIVKKLKRYRKNSAIKAVVLRVNSPGGGVAPSQEIYSEVKKLVEQKPVVVSMGALAASGGYYVASPANWIVANPGTLTGSIGVIMEIPNIRGLMDKIGIDNQVVKSGKNKDLGSAFRPLGAEERAILQGVLDDVHEQFIAAVADGRGLGTETVRPLADGRIYTGEQAQELGLVDELGDLEDAVLEAGRLAKIEGEPDVVGDEEEHPWRDLLRESWSGLFGGALVPTHGPRISYLYRP